MKGFTAEHAEHAERELARKGFTAESAERKTENGRELKKMKSFTAENAESAERKTEKEEDWKNR
jgi:hypothetical protein